MDRDSFTVNVDRGKVSAMTLALFLKHWKLVLIAGLVTFGAVQAYRIGNLKHALDVANGRYEAYKRGFNSSEAARNKEASQSKASYNDLNKRCLTNYEEALKRGQTIQTIVNRPPPASGRGVIAADELQQLISQDAGN